MFWPPPKRGDRVSLTCECAAIILVAVPGFFLYLIRVRATGPHCRAHRAGSNRFVRLERIRSTSGE
jgi:hypothetical protein